MYNAFELIREDDMVDDRGYHMIVPTVRQVMGYEKSVGMSEFYQAAATGFKPELKIVLTNWMDYQGEKILRYIPFGMEDPIVFDIIRTFRKGDTLEITCQRGVDHGCTAETN